MSFIVYNKNTGKYLKKHSGSYRALKRNECYKDYIKKEFGPEPSWWVPLNTPGRTLYEDYWNKVSAFILDRICQAEPGDARQYATEGLAIASIGERTDWTARECRRDNKPVYILPDYFELHEVAQTFVVVKKPDNTTTTK